MVTYAKISPQSGEPQRYSWGTHKKKKKKKKKMCSTLRAYHVQHVVCHAVRRDSSAIKFDRVEIAFVLTLSYWLKLLTIIQQPKAVLCDS